MPLTGMGSQRGCCARGNQVKETPIAASKRRRLMILFLLGLATLVFVPRTSFLPINDDSDGMYAEIPREMVSTGDWITPHANGIRYLEKPPLLYWLTALSYSIGGVSEFTARLPGALAAIATVFLCFLIGDFCFGPAAGLWAGIIMSTAPGYLLFSQQIMPDTLFTALLALALYGYLRGYTGGTSSFRWYLVFYFCLGLALLAKGLIGLVFPILAVGAFLLLNRELSRIREMRLGLGSLIVLAVAAPWHIAISFRNPGFLWFYFINEHLLRFLGLRYPRDYGTVSLLAFWALHIVWFFPWSFFFPLVRRALRLNNKSPMATRLVRFLLLWVGAVLLFYSFSTRLEYYTMPAFPAIAVLLGAAAGGIIEARSDHPLRRRMLWVSAGLLLTGLLVLAAMISILALTRHITSVQRPLVNPESPYYVFFFSPIFSLSIEAWRALRLPIVGVSCTLFTGALAVLIFTLRSAPRPGLAVLAVSCTLMLPWFDVSDLVLQDAFSSRTFARMIQQRPRPNALIVVDGQYELYSSLAFYTRQRLYIHDGRVGYLEYGSRYRDCPPVFLDSQQVAKLWAATTPVFYMARAEQKPPFDSAHCQRLKEAEHRVLWENGTS
jgi:4-amino-4-deoxy-L-arabinose transferase-like glycosyltransferase